MLLKKPDQGGAEKAAAVLGNLRGLAAKVGQMASYVDGVVPEAQREIYESTLKKLQSQTLRSSAKDVRATIEADLGAPPEEIFQTFTDEPFASASIGQVHRAITKDGTAVAVKVQHAHIQEAVESDLSNASLLQNFGSLTMGTRVELDKMLEVMKARFREELDYEHEAEQMRFFSELHADDAQIRLPKIYPEASGKHVLTTEFVSGSTFDEACAASESERRQWAETLWRFVFKGNLVGCRFNADPHPGNYIFHPSGQVTFLDFGCVQKIAEENHVRAVEVHVAAMRKDESAFREGCRAMFSSKPGALEDAAIAYTRKCFEPLFGSPYRITRGYSAELVTGMKALAKMVRSVPEEEFFTMPSNMLFMNRLQFGFYSVLARLDVEVDYVEVERAFML